MGKGRPGLGYPDGSGRSVCMAQAKLARCLGCGLCAGPTRPDPGLLVWGIDIRALGPARLVLVGREQGNAMRSCAQSMRACRCMSTQGACRVGCTLGARVSHLVPVWTSESMHQKIYLHTVFLRVINSLWLVHHGILNHRWTWGQVSCMCIVTNVYLTSTHTWTTFGLFSWAKNLELNRSIVVTSVTLRVLSIF